MMKTILNRFCTIALACTLWLLVTPFALALSGGESNAETPQIPIPKQNFSATIEDGQQQLVSVQRFTWEGKVFFRGQYGNATISIPFSKVRSLVREQKPVSDGNADNPDAVSVLVELKNGETVSVFIERSSRCYGEAAFGNYEIFFSDINRISFQ